VVTRLEALKKHKLESNSFGVDFAKFLAELSVFNSNFKTLIEIMATSLKQTQVATQQQSKQDGEKTLASSTPDGKTAKEIPAASLSPCNKKPSSQKGNGSCETGAQISECTHSNNKTQSRTRSKEVVRPRSPPHGLIDVQAMEPINVPSSSTEDDENKTAVEERRHGSPSPDSDEIFVPARLSMKPTQRARNRATSNAQGKALVREKALCAEKEAATEIATGKNIPPSRKVCKGGQ
jgi:hypothetical protein